MSILPYNGNGLRKKTFMNFVIQVGVANIFLCTFLAKKILSAVVGIKVKSTFM